MTSPMTTATANAVQKSSTVTFGSSHAASSTTERLPDEREQQHAQPAEPDRGTDQEWLHQDA